MHPVREPTSLLSSVLLASADDHDLRMTVVICEVSTGEPVGWQVTSSMRYYKMLEERIRWGAESAGTEGRYS